MFTTLALAIAHLKVGLKGRKTMIGIYPNKLVYMLLNKLKNNGLILGYGLYRSKTVFIYKNNLNKLQNKSYKQRTTIKKRYYLISVYFKYNYIYDNVLKDINLISTTGHRVYFKYRDVLKAYNKGDIYLLSISGIGLLLTSEIILNNIKLGGEVICKLDF